MLISLYLGLVLFAAMGAALLWKPQYLTRLTSVELTTVESRNEVRAVYGGFGITMAIALVIALVDSSLRRGICLTTALALIGMAGGRGYSLLLERTSSTMLWGFLIGETILSVLLYFQV